MATSNFIGLEALTHVADQVGTQIVMGPAYADPELLDRLGISVISGMQFKKTDHILVRKGGTTRRKVVGKSVNSKIGYLKERVLVAKLSWNRYVDNIDNYVETVFGNDGTIGSEYPLSTAATEAILKSYAEDLAENLFFGNTENSGDLERLSLYDGFHTVIAADITDGVISAKNGNLIPLGETITEPTSTTDYNAYKLVEDWYTKWDARLRMAKKVIVLCDVKRGIYIAAAYANKFHGNLKVNYLGNGNFTIPELPNVEFAPSDIFGVGSQLIATIPGNLQYGVDTLNNQTRVNVQIGSDTDAQDVIFQIQSIQGTRLMNPLATVFCMSDDVMKQNILSGDYQKTTIAISVVGDGSVTVNGTAYTDAVEVVEGSVVTLKATPTGSATFKGWSNGSTDAEITVVANNSLLALAAEFSA